MNCVPPFGVPGTEKLHLEGIKNDDVYEVRAHTRRDAHTAAHGDWASAAFGAEEGQESDVFVHAH